MIAGDAPSMYAPRSGMAADEEAARGPVPVRSEGPPRLAWHHASAEEVASYWQTDGQKGLPEELARDRLAKIGHNKLPEAPAESFLARIWGQISDFTVLALLAAATTAA